MIKNYIKIAWRNILKNPMYTGINVFGLSIGIMICMLITLYVKDELSFDNFFTKKNEIYRIVVEETTPQGEVSKFGQTGMIHGPAFQRQVTSIKNMVRYQQDHLTVKLNDEIILQQAFLVDSTYFEMFDANFIDGSPSNSLIDPHSVVVSKDVANKYFNTSKAVGKTLEMKLGGEVKTFIVSGVIENPPINSSLQPEMLIPIHSSKNEDNNWINFYINTFVQIEKGTKIENVEKQLATIYANDAKEEIIQAAKEWNFKNSIQFKLQPFLDIHLSKDFRAVNGLKESGNVLFSYFLSGVALLILLIACINFVNLSIARSIQRSKEVGVKKTIGSSRGQLIFQFLSESFLLNILAFALGILLTFMFLPIFNDLSDKQLSFSYLFDIQLVIIFISIFLITGFLAGFYPALVLSSFQPTETLYGRIKHQGKNLLQKSLIVFQFCLASFFIIFSIVQFRQANLFLNKDLGYNDKNLIEVNVDGLSLSKAAIVESQLKNDPNILSVSPMNNCCWMTGVTTSDGKEISPYMKNTISTFTETMGIKVKEGRFFSNDFPGDSLQSALVNEAFVKASNLKDPVGQTIKVMNRDQYQIVGIVEDYHHNSLYETITPQVFLSNPRHGFGTLLIRINDVNITNTLKHIKQVFNSNFPSQPYKYSFVEETNAKNYTRELKMRQMIIYSALIIIFISCIGMFGLATLTAERRTKEMGIRKIMGASLLNILSMMSVQFLKLIFVAFIISVPLAYFAINSILQNLPFRVDVSLDIFIYTFIGLIFMSLLTSIYQAIKTALENPIKSLKTE